LLSVDLNRYKKMLHNTILKIRDENGTGNIYHELELRFDKIEVTIRDIIRERVYLEIEKYNKKADGYKFALVRPKDEEMLLNGRKKVVKHRVNPEKQLEVALKAFSGNGFFILVDDVQAEELDQVVTIRPDTLISFVKLTPLVGG